MLTDHDIYLFKEGSHGRLHDKLGCQIDADGNGARFAVWAPNANAVSVIGEWNGWSPGVDRLSARPDGSGIWEGRADRARAGQAYKYRISSASGVEITDKCDPFAFYCEHPPATGSRVWALDYEWSDGDWMASRGAHNKLDAPLSIYEVHLGSWRSGAGRRRSSTTASSRTNSPTTC